MIKFCSYKEHGGMLLGFGITAQNLILLREGKPIHIFMADFVPNSKDEIVIFYGESEKAIYEDFVRRGIIRKETQIKGSLDP